MKITEDPLDGQWPLKQPGQKILQIGDLYKPWYYTTCDKWKTTQIPNVCLIYDVQDVTIPTKSIKVTAHTKDCRGKHHSEYCDTTLMKDLEKNGQKSRIICVKHYSKDMPNNITFLDGSKTDDLRCFEGHHRLITLERMGKPVNARIYHLYDLDPNNLEKHYVSTYDDTFWTKFNPPDKRVARWFTVNHFRIPNSSHKFGALTQCFKFIKTLKKNLKQGIDVGSAEGVYSSIASQQLGIPMRGIDLEKGRTLRGNIARHIINNPNITYWPTGWLDQRAQNLYPQFDFGMALSILHHIKDFRAFMGKFMANKKVAIVEARLRPKASPINVASILTIQAYDDFMNYLKTSKLNHKLITKIDSDRYFFVLWR